MTERQFIQLVKQLRKMQTEYKQTNNMRLHQPMTQLEIQVDIAIKQYEARQNDKEAKQLLLDIFFPDKPPEY